MVSCGQGGCARCCGLFLIMVFNVLAGVCLGVMQCGSMMGGASCCGDSLCYV